MLERVKIGYRCRRVDWFPENANHRGGTFDQIYILSVDCGVAWNPFMRQYPRSKEWTFATPSTPKVIADMSTNSEKSVVVLFSQSDRSASAAVEMANEIASNGGHFKRLEIIVGGTLTEVCAMVIECVSSCSDQKLFHGQSLTDGRLKNVCIVPNAREPSPDYRMRNGLEELPFGFSFKNLKDRVASKITSDTDLTQIEIVESAFEKLSDEISEVYRQAADLTSSFPSKLVIVTGTLGDEASDVVKNIATPLDLILGERETARARNGIKKQCDDLKEAISSGRRVIAYGPTPRATDRAALSFCANEAASIAWVTRPAWSSNLQNAQNALHSSDLKAVSIMFEDPHLEKFENTIRSVVRLV